LGDIQRNKGGGERGNRIKEGFKKYTKKGNVGQRQKIGTKGVGGGEKKGVTCTFQIFTR